MSPDAVRAPDVLTEDLPGYPWASRFRDVGGLRAAHLDEGPADASPVVLVHGEPTWSYLWRTVMPPLLEAGHRCVAPDHLGFGRSDKPTDLQWYTYDRHAANLVALLDELDLEDVTMVVHDWGGPIGLRAAVERRERVSRLVVLDTGLFTGEQPMSEAWHRFRDFVERTEDLPVGFLVQGATARELSDDEVAAYDAPFPNAASKAGARAFPLMLPTSPEGPVAEAGKRVKDALADDGRPTLLLWADADPIIPVKAGEALAKHLGAPPPEVVGPASHFLQEDVGEQIGRRIAAWLAEQRA